MKLKVSEIFYSLQGEGLRAGTPTIFIRLQGCKAKNACFAYGVLCDTEFESGKEMALEEILDWIEKNAKGCKEITWTGGEPLGQLKDAHTEHFNELGFYQTIETSGLFPLVKHLDFITISPKVAEHVLEKNFKSSSIEIDELKYVRHSGQEIPKPILEAQNYYISPHSDGWNINSENLKHCIELCKQNPEWKLSIQQHKLWKVL